eukprot:gene44530-60321_t
MFRRPTGPPTSADGFADALRRPWVCRASRAYRKIICVDPLEERAMNLGYFMMPNHPPHRTYADAHAHNLDTLEFIDSLGYSEAWVGEHYTCKREPLSCPDILIAQ